MMTVITRIELKEGSEPEWDDVMRERLEAAKTRQGWVAGQIAMPLDSLRSRLIVGTWRTRADWEAWHEDPTFEETRERLEHLQASPGETTWHEVIAGRRAEVGEE
jgi:heme-degrading monooxygenase HmoA